MAFLDHNGESEFPFSKDKVFNALCVAIPAINGMKIETADKLQGRILVKAGVSLYSWGENIPIQLNEISENKTRVQITSSPKTGIMFGGAFDMGKNRKNIESILSYTSTFLSSYQAEISTKQLQPVLTEEYQKQVNPQLTNYQLNQKFMEQQNLNSAPWQERTWLVIILCIIFFPVGLYALWKNSIISKGWKIGITAIIAVIVIANLGDKSESTPQNASLTSSDTEKRAETEEQESLVTTTETNAQVEKEATEKQEIINKLKARAKRDWPDDYTTQEFWVSQQIEDYEYMLTIEANSIKKQAQRDWPLDFSTQKFWYNEQIEAKERMK